MGCMRRAIWTQQKKSSESRPSLDHRDPELHLGLGNVFEYRNKYDDALEEYRRAEHLNPNSPFAHRAIGRTLMEKKDYPQALEELKEATILAPSDAYSH